MRRVPAARLLELSEQLGSRELEIVAAVERLRMLQAEQLRRLFFSDVSSRAGSARLCRRALGRLTEEGLLHRLERRVGGVRAGSSGHIYAASAAGKRLLAYRAGTGVPSDRGVHEPGRAFVAHTLAVSELYVTLVEAARASQLELVSFEPEPHSWRTYTGPLGGGATLKPDAQLVVARGEYEYPSFVEVDCGSEGRGALLRKLDAYLAYYRSGREQTQNGVFPHVIWLAQTPERVAFIAALVAGLPAPAQRIFVSGSFEDAPALLLGEHSPSAEESLR